jgi:putative membrane protein
VATPSEGPGPDASAPTGDDAIGHRLHPLSIVFGVLVNPLELLPLMVLLAATGLWRALPVVVLVALLVRGAQWQARRFSFDGTLLRLDEGVLQRSIRRLPVDRVQEVELVRTLRHQVLGVTTVLIQSAGDSGSAEIELNVLGRGAADALRDEIFAARDAARARARGPGDPPTAPDAAPSAPTRSSAPPVEGLAGVAGAVATGAAGAPAPRQLVRLGPRRLGLAGVTGAQLAAVLVVVAWIVNLADDLPDELVPDIDAEQLLVADLLLLGVLALGVVALWIGAAVAAGIVTNWDLTLTLAGDDVKLQRGLLNRRETIIPLGRLQVATVVANPARRLLGYSDLHLRSAGSMDERQARAVVPMLRAAECEALLATVLPGAALAGELIAAPPPARTRQMLAGARRFAVGALAVAWLGIWWRPALLAPLLALPLGVAFGAAAHRALGHRVDPELAVIRSGPITRSHRFVPLAKVQSARRSQSWFQRRRDLASLHLDVGGVSAAPTVIDQWTDLVDRLASTLPTVWWTARRTSASPRPAPAAERRTDPHPEG